MLRLIEVPASISRFVSDPLTRAVSREMSRLFPVGQDDKRLFRFFALTLWWKPDFHLINVTRHADSQMTALTPNCYFVHKRISFLFHRLLGAEWLPARATI